MRHCLHQAEHFIGFLGREHRGGLVENDQPTLQIQLFEDFQFLFFASGQAADRSMNVQSQGHVRHERFKALVLGGPIDTPRQITPRQHQVFRNTQAPARR
ncbi:hypothetical protein ALO94_200295 [Pseudomonas syringae pv. spinaceae]|uniref:Transporter n=1 Tax=Pseudomonas syringae pv. spinaceae TaxID=264459 RepID=A0A0P9ZYF3_PSESX|nr:hypothetical protein ALO94_200295 [Pseudomonas syringae pv. spinaceae]